MIFFIFKFGRYQILMKRIKVKGFYLDKFIKVKMSYSS